MLSAMAITSIRQEHPSSEHVLAAQLCEIFRNSNHLDKLDRLQMNYIPPGMNEFNGAGTIITSIVSRFADPSRNTF
jgi:hypothetical protein